jgi:hypothetical protein
MGKRVLAELAVGMGMAIVGMARMGIVITYPIGNR